MPFKRTDSQYWYIRVNGVPKSSGTTDFAAAEALEAKLKEENWLRSKMGAPIPVKKHSWEEAVVEWVRQRQDKKTLFGDIAKIQWLHKHLGHITDLNDMTAIFVDEVMIKARGASQTMASPSNATTNRYVALISAIMHAARDKWHWSVHVPKYIRYKEPPLDMHCWYKPHEYLLLEDALPEHLKYTARLALATGLRAGKVYGLQWNQIDFYERTLTTDGTENKLAVHIPLNNTAMQILEEIGSSRTRDRKWVFVYQGERIDEHHWETWAKAHEKAGIRYRKFHGLRHTFNSWLAQRGCSPEIRKRLCGWSPKSEYSQVIDRYTHLDVEHLRPWTAKIDEILHEARDRMASQNANFVSGKVVALNSRR